MGSCIFEVNLLSICIATALIIYILAGHGVRVLHRKSIGSDIWCALEVAIWPLILIGISIGDIFDKGK